MSVLMRKPIHKGRWISVGAATVVVATGTGLLYLVLRNAIGEGGALRYAPYAALLCYAAAPFVAAVLSRRSASLAAAAGGLALGIGATVAAAAIDQGGNGAMPIALGTAVAGLVALEGTARELWTRLFALAAIFVYALTSGRLISVVFAYPLLGLADEVADVFAARAARRRKSLTS